MLEILELKILVLLVPGVHEPRMLVLPEVLVLRVLELKILVLPELVILEVLVLKVLLPKMLA